MGDVALVEAAIAARLKANAPAPSHSQWVNARYGNGYRGYGDGPGHERSASGTSSSASSGYRSGPQLRPPPLPHRPSLTGLVQVRTKDTGFEYWTTATLFQRVELGLFTVLSQIDFALHVGVAISAINVDHSWYTQGFWYVAFMMLTCILVAWLLVRLVSKITAGGSAAGVELQNKLQTKYESSAALLLLSLIQPELLLLLLPEPRSHHITLLLLDGFRSLLEGLPFLLMSLLFITRPNAFGGDATMASVLAIISMGWTVITLALKLFGSSRRLRAHAHGGGAEEIVRGEGEIGGGGGSEARSSRSCTRSVRTIIMETRSSSGNRMVRMEAMLKGMMMATRSRMDTARRIPVLGFDTVRREILFLRADSEREYESVRVTCEREMGRAACRACARAERGRRRVHYLQFTVKTDTRSRV